MHSSWVVGSDNVAGNKLLALQGVSGLIGTLWSIRANCVKAGKTACLCARVLTSQRGVTHPAGHVQLRSCHGVYRCTLEAALRPKSRPSAGS